MEPTCVTFHRPDGTLRAPRFGLQGGGVYVNGNGVGNFEDCNIHDNAADSVSFLLNPDIVSTPRWNVTCAPGWQDGGAGGLYIAGTATLTNTSVYSNQASSVCLHLGTFLELSSIAPLVC